MIRIRELQRLNAGLVDAIRQLENKINEQTPYPMETTDRLADTLECYFNELEGLYITNILNGKTELSWLISPLGGSVEDLPYTPPYPQVKNPFATHGLPGVIIWYNGVGYRNDVMVKDRDDTEVPAVLKARILHAFKYVLLEAYKQVIQCNTSASEWGHIPRQLSKPRVVDVVTQMIAMNGYETELFVTTTTLRQRIVNGTFTVLPESSIIYMPEHYKLPISLNVPLEVIWEIIQKEIPLGRDIFSELPPSYVDTNMFYDIVTATNNTRMCIGRGTLVQNDDSVVQIFITSGGEVNDKESVELLEQWGITPNLLQPHRDYIAIHLCHPVHGVMTIGKNKNEAPLYVISLVNQYQINNKGERKYPTLS